MKKAIIIIIALIASVMIGVLALLTALRLKTEESIAPTAPKVKPRAEEPTPPPLSNVCTVTFTLNTPTPGPSATPTPTPSPTPKDNVPPKCTSLSASPVSGDAPLLVTLVASGYDNNEGYVAGFDFTFGDGETKKIEQTFNTSDSYTITHSYGKLGTYIASVRVKDNNGAWSDVPAECKQTITVKGAAGATSTPPPLGQPEPSPTPTPTIVSFVPTPTEVAAIPQVPQAGNFIPTIMTIVGGAIILAVGVLAL